MSTNAQRTNAPTMRVFISYEGFCEPFDIPPDQTVGSLKKMVKDNFLVQLSDDQQVRQYLELSYSGAALQDNWGLSDIGITSSSVIGCLKKSEQRPVMHVFNSVTGETLPISGNESLLQTSVAKLKTLVSMQSGIPVSTFRLSTPASVQLYDCNWLQDYDIEVGTILRLDAWDGWVEFLQGCLCGHRLTVQRHLSEEKPVMRFQLRVALYIAASMGQLDLAGWLLEQGVHPGEPVGVHPYRQWCQQTAHQDTGKCPIHIAAQNSQLLILKLFITKNLWSLACRDPGGRDPLSIAIQYGHTDCVRYLANKLCSVVSLRSMFLPVRIYLQIKRWARLGQDRVASSRGQFSNVAFTARLGNILLVDGFNQPMMSSKSRKTETTSRRSIKAKALQPLPPINNSPLRSHLLFKRATLCQPSVKEMPKKQRQCMKSREDGLLDQMKGDNNLCKGKFILPLIKRDNIRRPVFEASPKSFRIVNAPLKSSHHCDQTLRENAAYCLTIASTFTEKPWLKQLNIARTLARKYVHSEA